MDDAHNDGVKHLRPVPDVPDNVPESVRDLAPLRLLAQEHDVAFDTMRRWADAGRRNNFPEVKRRVGNVKFYSRTEVAEWVYLWSLTTKGASGG